MNLDTQHKTLKHNMNRIKIETNNLIELLKNPDINKEKVLNYLNFLHGSFSKVERTAREIKEIRDN